MPPIRPSALALAEKCGLSVELAEKYPEKGPWADAGTRIHKQIEAWAKTGEAPQSAAAQAACDLLRAYEGWTIRSEEKIDLVDPESGDLITSGTPDIVAIGPDKQIVVIDWKTGWAGHVPEPDENLQLLAYGAAAMIKYGGASLQVVVAKRLFDPEKKRVDHSRIYDPDDVWPIVDRIVAVQGKAREAHRGVHCRDCFNRLRCYAWVLPAHEGETALTPLTKTETELTNEQRVRALLACDAMEEVIGLVRARIRSDVEAGAVVEAGGKVYKQIMSKGRETVSVKDARAAGAIDLIKRGAPYPVWRWVSAKEKR